MARGTQCALNKLQFTSSPNVSTAKGYTDLRGDSGLGGEIFYWDLPGVNSEWFNLSPLRVCVLHKRYLNNLYTPGREKRLSNSFLM